LPPPPPSTLFPYTTLFRSQLVRAVREQAEAAMREADAIVLVVDAVEGLAAPDRELAQLLRRGGKPVFLAANKVDSNRREESLDLDRKSTRLNSSHRTISYA